MTRSTTATRFSVSPERSALRRRLMARITLAFGIVFLIVSAITVISTMVESRNQAENETGSALTTAAEVLKRGLDEPVNAAMRVANTSAMQTFAAEVRNLSPQSDLQVRLGGVYDGMLRAMDDVVTQAGQAVDRMRYIARDGQIWAQVINDGDTTEIRGPAAQVGAGVPGLVEALGRSATTTPYLAREITSVGVEGGELNIYAPVSQRQNPDNVLGVIHYVWDINALDAIVTRMLEDPRIVHDSRSVMVVDSAGRLVVSSMEETAPEGLQAFLGENTGEYVLRSFEGQFVSTRTIDTYEGSYSPWRLVLLDGASSFVTDALLNAVVPVLFFALIFGIALAAVWYALLRQVEPLSRASGAFMQLAGQDVSTVNNDEVEGLSSSAQVISERLQSLSESLDAQVKRRARDLELASRIGREVASLDEIDSLVNRALHLISSELGFYHTQVFLVDEAEVNAVLRYSLGDAGQKLLDQGFKIPVGSDTVIGTVTGERRAVIVNDTQKRREPHRDNPLLYETRAEMGLPLMTKDRLIGVLDIQSKEPDVFNEDDLPTYTLLADQLAVAIDHAQLISQAEARLQQVERLSQERMREAWQRSAEEIQLEGGYRYDLTGVERIDAGDGHVDGSDEEVLSAAISIRGQVIGELAASTQDSYNFTEGDRAILNAVANRLGLAIENARLFQETQSSLTETATLYQLSRYLNEAESLEDVVRAIVELVVPDASSVQVWLVEDYELAAQAEWLLIHTDYAITERSANNEDLRGLQLHIEDHPFLNAFNTEQIALVNDVRDDSRLDGGLKLTFRRLNAAAVVLMPLEVRDQWRGMITINFGEAREFTEREARLYNALSGQAAVAIDNRLLLQQTEEEVARNENLYAASRIINTARNLQDLVYAAVATTADPNLDFALSLFEGQLDETGWPKQARMVARSVEGMVEEADYLFDFNAESDSPLRNRSPELVIDDIPNNKKVPERVLWVREQQYRFMAIFPLFSANQPIALFHIMSEEIYELTGSDYEVYRALTGQMSSQIQIRKLLERTEAALDETRRLYAASRAITSAQDLDTIYQQAAEYLTSPFQAQEKQQAFTLSILITWPEAKPDAPYLDYVYQWNSTERTLDTRSQGERVTGDLLPYGSLFSDQDSVLIVPDIRADDDASARLSRVAHLHDELLDSGVISLAAAPIRRSTQKWFGVIVFAVDARGMFDEQFGRFMMAVADQVAIAVDNIRLVDEARFEADRAQTEAKRALALAEAAQLSNRLGDEDLAESLRDVFQSVAEVAGFDRWLLALQPEDAAGGLETRVAKAPELEPYETLNLDADDSMPLTDAFQDGQTRMVNDVASYPAFTDYPERAEDYGRLWGKHIVAPVTVGVTTIGSVLMGRDAESEDLDERDLQLVETLATQIAIALENRRLFAQAQAEQRNLRAILEALPAGMVVLEAHSLKPLQFNEQANQLLGREIDPLQPFSAATYNLFRTGTQLVYPEDETPIYIAVQEEREASTDDIAVLTDDEQVDLLMDAAPIRDDNGNITSIVVALQDISNLRSLENTLQENLRETVSLYEAQRQLAEASGLEEVLDVVMTHVILQQPSDAFILQSDLLGRLTVGRSFAGDMAQPDLLQSVLDEQEMVTVGDVQRADIEPDLRALLDERNARALMTVPINVSTRDMPVGWIVVFSDEPDGISAEQERVLTQLRDVAATAIDNRLLIESQQATLREVRSLYNATNAISRARDLESLQDVMADAVSVFDADFIYAYLDAEAGLQDGEVVLLSQFPDDVEPIDFKQVFEDYGIPPGGVYINDLSQITEYVQTEAELVAAGIRSFAAIHLQPKDKPSGLLIVAYRQPHTFTDSEDRYLNTLADNASVILNTFILFDQIQTSLEEVSMLYQANRALAEASGAQDILDVVINYLAGPHVDRVFIALLENDDWHASNAMVQVVAGWSQDESVNLEGVTLSQDQFPAWNQLASPSVHAIDDVEMDESLDMEQRIGIESLDTRSLVVIPLRVPNREIGVIWIGSSEPHKHTDREMRTYQAFADQASVSMEAAYLLAQTERRARQLETSSEVSRSAAQILDLEELLPRIVELIRDAYGYDHAQVFLMDEKDEYAELRASTGEAGRQLLSIQHRLAKGSDSVIGKVTQNAEPQIALDTADASVIHQPNPYLPLTRSEMALPLIIKGRVVGALDVQSNQAHAFNEEDVRALTTLASQIAVAIDNANLYESAQSQAERMSFLFEITSAAASADTLEESLETVSRNVHEQLDALSVLVYLPEDYVDERDPDTVLTMLKATSSAGLTQPLSEIEEVELSDEGNLLVQVANSKQAFVVEDVEQRADYLPAVQEARSAVVIPMTAANELIGLIVMEDERPNAFDYDKLQLLLTLSGSLSAVVQSIQLLDQLRETNEQLRELDRIKSEFLANMSHELRTPLNSIIGFSRVLLKGIDGPLTEMQEQDLTTIFNSGQHLLMLINDILDQAKIAADKLDLKLEYFDPKPLIEGVKSIGVGLVKDKPIDMRVDMEPNLPNVYGDQFRTRQVLLNLVSNASKFTEEGSITISVYTINEDGREMVRMDVADTGVGIAEKDIPLLFEAFRQVDSSLTRMHGGTGLGLPIAKSLAEMQGGDLMVESQVNVGSTFSITVPTHPVDEQGTFEAEQTWQDDGSDEQDDKGGMNGGDGTGDLKALDEDTSTPQKDKPDTKPNKPRSKSSTVEVKTATPADKARVRQPKRQVLLIEDDRNMVDQYRRLLQREGFEVQTADHAAYAEAMVSNLRPNVVILDVNFGDGEGWNILERLKDRDDTFDLPVVVVTLDSDSERAYQLGAHSFLQRPYDPEALVQAVLQAEEESNRDRILIIDDQPESVRLLTELLRENGTFRVFSAESGVEGISMVARRHPDLVILDLRMPDKDGFAVLEELRANPETADIPVLVVTGDRDLKDEEQEQLNDLRVLYKADISDEEHEAFIKDVQEHLKSNNGE